MCFGKKQSKTNLDKSKLSHLFGFIWERLQQVHKSSPNLQPTGWVLVYLHLHKETNKKNWLPLKFLTFNTKSLVTPDTIPACCVPQSRCNYAALTPVGVITPYPLTNSGLSCWSRDPIGSPEGISFLFPNLLLLLLFWQHLYCLSINDINRSSNGESFCGLVPFSLDFFCLWGWWILSFVWMIANPNHICHVILPSTCSKLPDATSRNIKILPVYFYPFR